MDSKHIIQSVKKVVVKIGSAVLTDGAGSLDCSRISLIIEQIVRLLEKGIQVIIVTSGAITAGTVEMGLGSRPKTLPRQQAAAAVGQNLLMGTYHNLFKKHKRIIAQILLTADDLKERGRHLNARNTLLTLINEGIIPIINENDTVSVDEIKFGDNDRLCALVSNLVQADLLINLSDIDGLMTSDPKKEKTSELIHVVEKITPAIERLAGGVVSSCGTGGMCTKIAAAKMVTRAGEAMIIANGKKDGIIDSIFRGEIDGTLFFPNKEKMSGKKRWIAFFIKPKGVLEVDEGAKKALLEGGKSLLSSGISHVSGKFQTGDTVSVVNNGKEVARGLTNYSHEELEKIKGFKTSEIEGKLGYKHYDEVIHRDNLVII